MGDSSSPPPHRVPPKVPYSLKSNQMYMEYEASELNGSNIYMSIVMSHYAKVVPQIPSVKSRTALNLKKYRHKLRDQYNL